MYEQRMIQLCYLLGSAINLIDLTLIAVWIVRLYSSKS